MAVDAKMDVDLSAIKDLFSSARVRGKVLGVLTKYEKKMLDDFHSVTENFSHHVEFYSERKYAGAHPQVLVGTNDEIFYYIDQGTGVRYATMTKDFVPKTSYRSITTGQGQGGVAYVNRRVPRPGIKGREFADYIATRHFEAFSLDLLTAISESIR